MIAYGTIGHPEVEPSRWPSRLDAQALGQRYLAAGPTRLADKYPLDYSTPQYRDPQRPTHFARPERASRFELRAVFTSPSGVSEVDIRVWRRDLTTGLTSVVTSSRWSAPSRPRVATVDYVFIMPSGGAYSVIMTPIVPSPATQQDTAVWHFDGTSFCGDSYVENGEQCDDGNNTANDGCSPGCRFEFRCGDGVAVGAEECDDGNLVAGDGCAVDCTWEAYCGDGIVQSPPEQCDDGNLIPFDFCSNQCMVVLE